MDGTLRIILIGLFTAVCLWKILPHWLPSRDGDVNDQH